MPDGSPAGWGRLPAPGWFDGEQYRLGIDVLFMAERLGLQAGAVLTLLLAGQEASWRRRPLRPRRDSHDWPREN